MKLKTEYYIKQNAKQYTNILQKKRKTQGMKSQNQNSA